MSIFRSIVGASLFLLACGSAITDPNPLDPDRPSVTTATGCAARCENLANRCGNVSSAQCHTLCESVTESQFTCVENAGCDSSAGRKCIKSAPRKDAGPAQSDGGKSDSGTTKPSEVTVTGHFGVTKAIHIMSSDKTKVYSSVSVSPNATFSPELSFDIPNVTKAESVTINSPAPGGCDAQPSFTLNYSQVGVTMTTTDVLPSSACTTFTDKVVSKGLDVTLRNVPYPNGGVASKVTIKLTP